MASSPLAAAASLPAFGAGCDAAFLRGLDAQRDQLTGCARDVAAKPTPADGVGGELLRAALDAVADASITRPEPDQAEVALRLIGDLDRRGVARQAGTTTRRFARS